MKLMNCYFVTRGTEVCYRASLGVFWILFAYNLFKIAKDFSQIQIFWCLFAFAGLILFFDIFSTPAPGTNVVIVALQNLKLKSNFSDQSEGFFSNFQNF